MEDRSSEAAALAAATDGGDRPVPRAWEAKDFLEVDADASDEQLREIAPNHPAFRITFA